MLSVDRIKRLELIGYVFRDVLEVQWMKMYDRLVAYKKQHKSTQVSSKFIEDPQLGMWAGTQRVAYNTFKLLKKS
jgi:hypothetical protein